jgi:TolA-binding protein
MTDPMEEVANAQHLKKPKEKKPNRAELRIEELEAKIAEMEAGHAAQLKEVREDHEKHNRARNVGRQGILRTIKDDASVPGLDQIIEWKRKVKRPEMTEEEEELYKEHTDPVTGEPPLDIRGVRGSCIISW